MAIYKGQAVATKSGSPQSEVVALSTEGTPNPATRMQPLTLFLDGAARLAVQQQAPFDEASDEMR